MRTVAGSPRTNLQAKRPAGFLYALLTGAGQVMFQENPITGLFFLGGIFYTSPRLGVAGLIGLVASTATALWLGASDNDLRRGLHGYNGFLVGLALATFLRFDVTMLVYTAAGSAFSAPLTLALTEWLRKRELPVLTTPFVLATWVCLLAAFVFSRVQAAGLPTPALPGVPAGVSNLPVSNEIARGILTGVGQIMLVDNVVTGGLFLAGVALNSVPSAVLCLIGSVLGMATGVVMGGPVQWTGAGLYGFNGALVATALGAVFIPPSVRSFLHGAIGAILSTLVFAALVVFLKPVGMPVLTMPFILTTTCLLLARRGLTSGGSSSQGKHQTDGG